MKNILILWIFFLDCTIAENFKVAVVHFMPERDPSDIPPTVLKKNAETYGRVMSNAKQENVRMIIFPQYGLSTFEPNEFRATQLQSYAVNVPTPPHNFCDNRTQNIILTHISCAAKTREMIVVVPVIEKFDNDIYYQTVVVFDKNGSIIQRYRGRNLGPTETEYNKGTGNFTYFKQDNISFGILNGYDIFNKTTVNEFLDSKPNVIILTSAFPVDPPLTGISVQDGFARFLNKNHPNITLLSAGLETQIVSEDAKHPFATGSLIYLKNEKFHYMISTENEKNYIVEDIFNTSVILDKQIISGSVNITEKMSNKDTKGFTVTNLNLNLTNKFSIGSGDSWCEISITGNSSKIIDTHRVLWKYDNETRTVICSLVQHAAETSYIATAILTLKYNNVQEEIYALPLTLRPNFVPVTDIDVNYEKGTFIMKLTKEQEIFNFGVFAQLPETPIITEKKSEGTSGGGKNVISLDFLMFSFLLPIYLTNFVCFASE